MLFLAFRLIKELVSAGRPVIQDGGSGAAAVDEARIEQDAQVMADRSEREAGDRNEVGRAGGLIEEAQDIGTGGAEESAQGGWRAVGACVREQAGGRVDDRVAGADIPGDPAFAESAGDEQQLSSAQIVRRVVPDADPQLAVAETPHRRGEAADGCGPAR